MSKQTAMQQLKAKIQVVIGDMNGELSSYESGYKQCLINIQNDIELQMMAMEKEQIETLYTKEDVLKAGEIGEINHYDYKHIVSLLDEAKAINQSLKK